MGKKFFIFYFLFFLFLFSGCALQKRACPPLTNPGQAQSALKDNSANLKPFKATGSCTLNYTDEKGKKFAQSFPIRMWFQSERNFCLYGDVMFDPQGIGFVVNNDEYWTYAKPLRVFISGKVNSEKDNYFTNPLILIDFLNPINSDSNSLTMAQSDKNYNILFCADNNFTQKKIYLDRCSYFVKKIEYLNGSKNPEFIIESDDYKQLSGGNFSFPRRLVYRNFEKRNQNVMRIKINNINLWQPNLVQLKALFAVPDVNAIQKGTK